MNIVKVLSAVGATSALTLSTLVTGPAALAVEAFPPANAKNNGVAWVLDETSAQRVGDRTFYPLPEEAKGKLVMTQEVAESLGIHKVGKMSPAATEVLKSRYQKAFANGVAVNLSTKAESDPASIETFRSSTNYWTQFWAGGSGNWGPWSTRNGSLWGWDETARWTPQWKMLPGSNIDGAVCGQAVGWENGYRWGDYGYYSKVYSVGCTSGARSVPWGEIAAVPQFRATTYRTFGDGGEFM